jgi:tRNA-binding EMAP/Myf-like protein
MLTRSRSVSRHPDADSLYVEKIDIGEAEPRTVCSGLVKYMSEDEITGATIIVIVSPPRIFYIIFLIYRFSAT